MSVRRICVYPRHNGKTNRYYAPRDVVVSDAQKRIVELTEEVERLREGWMQAECVHNIQYDEGKDRLVCRVSEHYFCQHEPQKGDYCEAVRKAVI